MELLGFKQSWGLGRDGVCDFCCWEGLLGRGLRPDFSGLRGVDTVLVKDLRRVAGFIYERIWEFGCFRADGDLMLGESVFFGGGTQGASDVVLNPALPPSPSIFKPPLNPTHATCKTLPPAKSYNITSQPP